MKMVKTFMKTQHQHMMPPEKGKGNAQSEPTGPTRRRDGGPALRRQDALGHGGRGQDSIQHSTTPHLSVSL